MINTVINNQQISEYVQQISELFEARNTTVQQMIQLKGICFRVSVIGNCNLNCSFCHNEGGPRYGRIDKLYLLKSMVAAQHIGFKRIQFTGGEPLLSKDIFYYVKQARQYFDEVGITTNGVLLNSRLHLLAASGVNRIHISPQIESLEQNKKQWDVPKWLDEVLLKSNLHNIKFRINLPVPTEKIDVASAFIRMLSKYDCDIEVFSILPYGNFSKENYDMEKAKKMILIENEWRLEQKKHGQISLRDFLKPKGLRCGACDNKYRCVDKSHALRLGVDGMLKPCLATRHWDVPIQGDDIFNKMFDSTILTLDY